MLFEVIQVVKLWKPLKPGTIINNILQTSLHDARTHTHARNKYINRTEWILCYFMAAKQTTDTPREIRATVNEFASKVHTHFYKVRQIRIGTTLFIYWVWTFRYDKFDEWILLRFLSLEILYTTKSIVVRLQSQQMKQNYLQQNEWFNHMDAI